MAVIRKNSIQLNKKSSVPNKAPEPSQLQYGEIAINYAAGSEAIYIKNTNDSIVNVTAGSGGGGGGTVGTLTTTTSTALSTQTSESLSNAVQLHKVSKTGSYNDLNNKPTIPSAPGTLTTTATTALATASNEALTGNIALHKVSKTGSYDDLNNKPTALSSFTEDATHRLVTDTEKSTWNSKQNAINDLTDIRNNASSGATAYTNMITGVTFNGNSVNVNNKVAQITATIPTQLSELSDDATHRLVTDTEKSTWNSKGNGTITGINMNGASKGTSGVVNLGTVITAETQLSTGTTSGNGNAVTSINVSNHQISLVKDKTFTTSGDVKTQIEGYNYLTGYTETDPTVPSWAKQTNKPTYTASEVGALPTGTTLDGVADGTTRKLSDTITAVTFNGATATKTNRVAAITATIPAAPGTLTTTATTSLTGASNEALSGNIALHKVSKTGSYNDLNNKPTIPTVNDSTITIQKGGTNVNSFTTNASSNKTINIPNELPAYSASDSGKVLSVNSSGHLVWITPVTIYTGTTAPDNSQGIDGDIYLQTS